MRVVNSQLSHCLDLLGVLAERGRGMRLTEIAAALDVPKSSTQRLLDHLAQAGWVEPVPETGQHRLTLRLAVLGRRHLQSAGIADLAQNILERLARRTGDLARLTAVDAGGRRLAWLAAAQGAPPGLRYEPAMGAPIPSFATANGKAWLATLPEAEALRIARADGLDDPEARARLGPGVLAGTAALVADLAAVRARGYAVADEEAEAGVMAVARAVRDGAAALGTVSVAGPVARVRPAVPDIAGALAESGTDLALAWPSRVPPMERVA